MVRKPSARWRWPKRQYIGLHRQLCKPCPARTTTLTLCPPPVVVPAGPPGHVGADGQALIAVDPAPVPPDPPLGNVGAHGDPDAQLANYGSHLLKDWIEHVLAALLENPQAAPVKEFELHFVIPHNFSPMTAGVDTTVTAQTALNAAAAGGTFGPALNVPPAAPSHLVAAANEITNPTAFAAWALDEDTRQCKLDYTNVGGGLHHYDGNITTAGHLPTLLNAPQFRLVELQNAGGTLVIYATRARAGVAGEGGGEGAELAAALMAATFIDVSATCPSPK